MNCSAALLDEPEVVDHAAAAVEHQDDADRLDVAREDADRLALADVVHLEVVAAKVGHEAAVRVGDGHVDRHRARARAKDGLLALPGRG